MSIQIVGLSDNMKVPGFFGETVYNAGPITAGDIPLVLCLVGLMGSSGSATPNQDILDIGSESDADDYFGPGTELATMCYGALQIPGVKIKAAPVADPGTPTAASATITISGSWTTSGTFTYRIDGVVVTGTVLSTHTISTLADAIVNAINGNGRVSVTAAKGSGPAYVITLTRKTTGARGNQGALYQDTSLLPSGCSSAIAGGTSMTGSGVHFSSGAGNDSVSTVLTLLSADQYDRLAFAENDATNAALIETWLNTQAGPLIGYTMHAVIAVGGSLSSATSLAQSTLNAERAQCLWYLDSETFPPVIAATFASYRTFVEQNDPDAAYDGYILPGVRPQASTSAWPSISTLISALDNSVTPIATNATGGAYVVRSITTYSLDTSGNPDYRTLDTSDAVVPDYVRNVLRLYWLTEFKAANPRVGPDPASTQKSPPSGVATPLLWNRNVLKILKGFEQGLKWPTTSSFTNGAILANVDNNPPYTEYNPVAKRLMSVVPVEAAPNQHQIGVSVRSMS